MTRIGANIALAAAYFIGAICVSCIALVGHNQTLVMLAVLGTGFGILGGQTVANALAAISYPTEIRSTGVGWATGFGRIGSAALESMARQPEVAPRVQTAMLIIAALLEGATFFSLIVCIIVAFKASW